MCYANNRYHVLISLPFIEELEASDKGGAVPDGTYATMLSRIEMFQGTRYESEQLQDKLRFIFVVSGGTEDGSEIWSIQNLPDKIGNRRKPLGKKSNLRKLVGQLRGKEMVDNESLKPSQLIGTQCTVQILDGKISALIPQPANKETF